MTGQPSGWEGHILFRGPAVDNGRSTLSFISCLQETAISACSFSMFILLSSINRAKHNTAVRHECLHGMPRFHVTFAKMAIS